MAGTTSPNSSAPALPSSRPLGQSVSQIFVRLEGLKWVEKGAKRGPGPGQYMPAPALTPSGSYAISKFRSSYCRSIAKAPRASLNESYVRLSTPGPGSYKVPSEFGIYMAQDKYVEEHLRVNRLRDKSLLQTRSKPDKRSTVSPSTLTSLTEGKH